MGGAKSGGCGVENEGNGSTCAGVGSQGSGKGNGKGGQRTRRGAVSTVGIVSDCKCLKPLHLHTRYPRLLYSTVTCHDVWVISACLVNADLIWPI